MNDLLTTRQVLELLKVDRITIYRMLQDGRLKGVKIGQQWRFPQGEVARLVGETIPVPETPQTETSSSFPTHCVQTIQDLFSAVSQISALVVDTAGEPLTEISHPCRFCQVMMQSPAGQIACRDTWRKIASQTNSGSRYFTCHAGMQYISAPIIDQEKTTGYFLAGQFYWQAPDPLEEAGRMARLTVEHHLPEDSLQQAARSVPLIPPGQHANIEGWPASAALAVQSILHERFSFMERLQQIASLTQIH